MAEYITNISIKPQIYGQTTPWPKELEAQWAEPVSLSFLVKSGAPEG
jgi:hypothetical protein